MILNINILCAVILSLSLTGYTVLSGIFEFLGINQTPAVIVMRTFILLTSLFILANSLLVKKKFKNITLAKLLLSFWLLYLVKIAIVTLLEPESLHRPVSDFWIWGAGVCMFPMLAVTCQEKAVTFKLVFKYVYVLTYVSALLALILGKTQINNGTETYDIGRLNTNSMNPITIGHLGATLGLLSLWGIVVGYNNEGKNLWTIINSRFNYIIGAFLGLILMLMAASRGPILSFSLAVIFYLMANNLSRFIKVAPIIVIAILILYPVGYYLESSFGYNAISRMEGLLSFSGDTISSRDLSFFGALNQFIENPIFGDTIEERTSGFYPHNITLEAFMATGIIGGLIVLSVYTNVFYYAVKSFKYNRPHTWILILLLHRLFAAQTSGALYSSGEFWVLLGAIVVLQSEKYAVINK